MIVRVWKPNRCGAMSHTPFMAPEHIAGQTPSLEFLQATDPKMGPLYAERFAG